MVIPIKRNIITGAFFMMNCIPLNILKRKPQLLANSFSQSFISKQFRNDSILYLSHRIHQGILCPNFY